MKIQPIRQAQGRKRIRFLELKRATPGVLKDINNLLPQLSKTAKPLSLSALTSIARSEDSRLVMAKDDTRIIGMGSLVFTLTPYGKRARIEDVVVDERYRGRGIGEKISKELITIAKKAKVRRVELSTRQTRVVARKLYEKLGFEKREADVYVRFLEKRKTV
ncbi:MAG: GNAT family N-acetyltransferase [Candidatus Colwellbacteria bacterium]|nr:GNAT family N-acetyltransferase [Candidatus Colwellbacteria bacterium]